MNSEFSVADPDSDTGILIADPDSTLHLTDFHTNALIKLSRKKYQIITN